jgi:hypothetical protein
MPLLSIPASLKSRTAASSCASSSKTATTRRFG